MKYHTTRREIIPALLVTILFTLISSWAVISLGLVDPSKIVSDMFFSALAEGDGGTIRLEHFDRDFLKRISVDDCHAQVGEDISVDVGQVSFDQGLLALMGKFFMRHGTIGVLVQSPVVSANLDAFLDPSSGGSFTNPLLASFSYRFSLRGLTAHLSYKDYVADGEKINATLSLKPSFAFQTLNLSAGSLNVTEGTTLHGVLEGVRLYGDDGGNASLQVLSSGGNYQDLSFHMQNCIANTRISASPYPVNFSFQSLSVSYPPYDFTIPLLSVSLVMEGETFNSGTVSFSNADGRMESYTLHLPTSTIAFSKTAEAWALAFAMSGKEEMSLDTGAMKFRFKESSGTLEAPKDFSMLTASLSVPSFFYDAKGISASLSSVSLQGTYSSLSSFHASLSGMLSSSFQNGETKLGGNLTLNLGMEKTLGASLSLTDATTNYYDGTFNLNADYHASDTGKQSVKAEVKASDTLKLDALLEQMKGEKPVIDANLELQGFSIGSLKPLLSTAAPAIMPFLDQDTTISGSFRLYTDITESGRLSFDSVLHGIKFGRLTFGCGFTGKGELVGNSLDISYLTLSIADYRILFQGMMDMQKLEPNGMVVVSNTESGNELLTVNFNNIGKATYSYQATTTRFPEFLIGGEMHDTGENFISDAIILAGGEQYPIHFNYDFNKLQFHAETGTKVVLDGYVGNPLHLTLVANRFNFPKTARLNDAFLSIKAEFSYEDTTKWNFSATGFDLSGIMLNGRKYDFLGDVQVTPEILSLTNVTAKEGSTTFVGSLVYKGTPLQTNVAKQFSEPFTLALKFSDSGQQKVDCYLGREDEHFETMVNVENLSLARFLKGKQDIAMNLQIVGETDLGSHFDMNGAFSFSGDELGGAGSIQATAKKIRLADGSFHYKTTTVDQINLEGDVEKGTLSLALRATDSSHISKISDAGSSVALSLDASFLPLDSLWKLGNLGEQWKNGDVDGKLSIKGLTVMGTKIDGFQDLSLDIATDSSHIALESPIFSFSYEFASGKTDGKIDKLTGLGCAISGKVTKDILYLSMDDVSFDTRLINTFIDTPVVTIKEGIATGNILLSGTFAEPLFYGQVYCDSLGLDCFYLPDDDLYAKNVVMWADGKTISTAMMPGFALSRKTGRKSDFKVRFAMTMEGWETGEMDVDLFMSPENEVMFYLPIPESFMELSAMVTGEFHFVQKLHGIPFSSGKATIRDANVAIGELKNCPSWYASGQASSDFTLTAGNNCKVFYPNTPNPMFSATLQEGQQITFTYDGYKQKFDMQGELKIRNGEIFYFQKNFYISEGNVAFRSNDIGNVLEPVLNLRARLRDFDSTGTPVDIYLMLNDSTLTNLNPQFESTPPKSLEEIMLLLGQSILPTTAYGNVSLYGVASLAGAATDVAQRMGWINAGSVTSLSDTIRKSLGLDMFSMHSSILQNILIDVLPGMNGVTISPIARYLNNTSIFLGKYIGKDMFLQALFHLQAFDKSSSKKVMSFLTNDLALNLELSLEWNTPLCTFSVFTQPNELSLIEFLDTIGFSVTKRIVLF
jgi:hypothetical protein